VRPGRDQIACVLLAVASVVAVRAASGQPLSPPTIQFPNTPSVPANAVPTLPSNPGTIGQPAFGAAGTTATPGAVSPYTGAAVPFDPYSASGSAAYNFWGTQPPPSNSAGVFAQPPTTPYAATTPFAPPPASPYAGPGLAPPPLGTNQPASLFPNGLGDPQFDLSQSMRFIQDLRLRETYVAGGKDSTDLGINDIETAVTFTVPNFLTTGQPLFISPAFALHLWDGPADIDADLPPQAYSAYLDFQWASDPQLQLGAELGFRVGAYTDFDTLNSDSLRIQGLALGTARLTPAWTLKLGVVYLDRNDIKLLPAGGLLWTPTPQVRFDFFFPQPKLSAYLTTVGRYELWWYAAGEYGGGAWTIERADDTSDRIDINDIRVSGGVEWTGPRGLTGFVEAGFVLKREVVYVVDPSDTFNPDDSWMIRAGIAF
jgi:hypothetical protein